MDAEISPSVGEHLKIHRVVNFNCFIGAHGKEEDIIKCVNKLQANPYQFGHPQPDSILKGQEVVCLSSVGWARAEIIKRVNKLTFKVLLLDYLEDEVGTPITESVKWEGILALPKKLSTSHIPRLAGVFYLMDSREIEQSTCNHVIDRQRLHALLTELASIDEVIKCCTVQPLGPLDSVVDIFLPSEMCGFPKGRLEIPMKRLRRPAGRRVKGQDLQKIAADFRILKERISQEQNADCRMLLMAEFERTLLGADEGEQDQEQDLEGVEGDSDAEQVDLGRSTGGPDASDLSFFASQSNALFNSTDSSSEMSSRAQSLSPYRKEKDAVEPTSSQSRKQRKKTRARKNNPILEETPTKSSEPSSQTPSSIIPRSFVDVDFSPCEFCGLRSRHHQCVGQGYNGSRSLDDMWSQKSQ